MSYMSMVRGTCNRGGVISILTIRICYVNFSENALISTIIFWFCSGVVFLRFQRKQLLFLSLQSENTTSYQF